MARHDVRRLGVQIEKLSHSLTLLAKDEDYLELIKIIHLPRWTTLP